MAQTKYHYFLWRKRNTDRIFDDTPSEFTLGHVNFLETRVSNQATPRWDKDTRYTVKLSVGRQGARYSKRRAGERIQSQNEVNRKFFNEINKIAHNNYVISFFEVWKGKITTLPISNTIYRWLSITVAARSVFPSLERWDRGFESHSRQEGLCALILCF
jgi:hypothetical protein